MVYMQLCVESCPAARGCQLQTRKNQKNNIKEAKEVKESFKYPRFLSCHALDVSFPQSRVVYGPRCLRNEGRCPYEGHQSQQQHAIPAAQSTGNLRNKS